MYSETAPSAQVASDIPSLPAEVPLASLPAEVPLAPAALTPATPPVTLPASRSRFTDWRLTQQGMQHQQQHQHQQPWGAYIPPSSLQQNTRGTVSDPAATPMAGIRAFRRPWWQWDPLWDTRCIWKFAESGGRWVQNTINMVGNGTWSWKWNSWDWYLVDWTDETMGVLGQNIFVIQLTAKDRLAYA